MASIPPLVQPTNQGLQHIAPPGNQLNITPCLSAFAQFCDDSSKDPCKWDYTHVISKIWSGECCCQSSQHLIHSSHGYEWQPTPSFTCVALPQDLDHVLIASICLLIMQVLSIAELHHEIINVIPSKVMLLKTWQLWWSLLTLLSCW